MAVTASWEGTEVPGAKVLMISAEQSARQVGPPGIVDKADFQFPTASSLMSVTRARLVGPIELIDNSTEREVLAKQMLDWVKT